MKTPRVAQETPAYDGYREVCQSLDDHGTHTHAHMNT